MALLDRDIKKELQKKSASIIASPKDDSFTNKEKAVMDLARLVIWGVLLLIAGLFSGLFILIATGNKNSNMYKDIVSAFIAVASGILGSILGYYYKNND